MRWPFVLEECFKTSNGCEGVGQGCFAGFFFELFLQGIERTDNAQSGAFACGFKGEVVGAGVGGIDLAL